jgi:alkanesulfonate monooxygenase SsuD/methylene tetrahydromethanopterin reductase-like flavin-dependent oxidoreductase (luciferase family)
MYPQVNVPSGINFFPSAWPEQKSCEQSFDEALRLSVLADQLGYSHIRVVEPYFRPYGFRPHGGMTPNPIVVLSAVAARTQRVRLVAGAVVPIFNHLFNHPIRIAAETAMLDAVSHGRLDVAFAPAFPSEELDFLERSLVQAHPRYEHGIDAVVKLWTQDEVTHQDAHYRFGPVTSSPRPVQQPHPPVFIAAIGTPQTFEWAARQGYGLMIVPHLSNIADLRRNVHLYREAFAAHHPDPALLRVPALFHLHVAETDARAESEASEPLARYVQVIRQGASAQAGRSPAASLGYYAMIRHLETMADDRGLNESRALIGSPETVERQIRSVLDLFGEVELSLQLLYGDMPYEQAARSLRLFAEHVMPRFQQAAAA